MTRHIDRFFPLPSQIELQMKTLLEFLNYKPIVNIRLVDNETKIMSTDEHPDGLKVTEARQCICLGSIDTTNATVIAWMIRPSINYGRAIFSCEYTMLPSVIAELRRFGAERANTRVSNGQLSFDSTRELDGTVSVEVTGPMCTHIMDSPIAKSIGLRLSSVAMGGSTLNITVLRSTTDGHKIVPVIIMNIKLIYSITSPASTLTNGMMCTRERNKEVIRFPRHVNDRMQGPSLTIGVNGGVQWIGNPSMFSCTFAKFVDCVSDMMNNKPEFISMVERSDIGMITRYPSGVSRRAQQVDI